MRLAGGFTGPKVDFSLSDRHRIWSNKPATAINRGFLA
jgi:hypothetical protein